MFARTDVGRVRQKNGMHAILRGASLESACASLVDTANARGGRDNITVLLLDITGDELRVTLEGEPYAADSP